METIEQENIAVNNENVENMEIVCDSVNDLSEKSSPSSKKKRRR